MGLNRVGIEPTTSGIQPQQRYWEYQFLQNIVPPPPHLTRLFYTGGSLLPTTQCDNVKTLLRHNVIIDRKNLMA